MEDERIISEENAEPVIIQDEADENEPEEAVTAEVTDKKSLEEKKARGRKKTIGIAATVGTIALGAVAIAAYRLFRRKK